MKTVVKRLYEAMFLVDSAEAAADWDGIIATIENVFKRADAEIISIKKWEERKLAYEIERKERGTYILSYFRAPSSSISAMERDVRLSERIMRVLVLNAEEMSEANINKDTPIMREEKRRTEQPESADSAGDAEVIETPEIPVLDYETEVDSIETELDDEEIASE